MSIQLSNRPTRLEELPGPKGLPFIGNYAQINFQTFHLQLERWAAEYGDFYRVQLAGSQFVVISDVEAASVVLGERPQAFGRRLALQDIFDELGFNGVFSAEDENWRRQRRIVVTALNSAHLHEFYAAMLETTHRLRRRWEKAALAGVAVDLCAELMRYTVDITTQLAFGIDFNTLETDGPIIQHHLDQVFPMLNRRLTSPFPYWRYFRFGRDRALDDAVKAVRAQITDIITSCRARLADSPAALSAPRNFLEAMMAAQASENLAFTDDDIIANAFTLLLAGEDTTANTLAWAIKFFTDYPAMFTQVRAEVDAVLGQASAPESRDQAMRLPLVEAFANETMRLKPVAPLLIFDAKIPIEVGGLMLTPGTGVILLSRGMAIASDNFAQPEQFMPARWLDKTDPAQRVHNAKAFVPFGGGPRFCPGRNLALLEIKVVLAMLCRNFDVEMANEGKAVEEVLAFTMVPSNLWVRFKKRC